MVVRILDLPIWKLLADMLDMDMVAAGILEIVGWHLDMDMAGSSTWVWMWLAGMLDMVGWHLDIHSIGMAGVTGQV